MSFIKGVDISILEELEALGVKYYDQGVNKDLFDILTYYDVNTIRLRLWHDPYDEQGHPYGGGTNDMEKTIHMAKRAKAKNLQFVLDLHYSDFWTDPGKQIKPKAWKNLSEVELENKVYQYTYETVKTFKEEGVQPEIIQIGNEITNGFLWPDGKTPNYDTMCSLLKQGIQAVKDIDTKIKIILHLDFGGDNKLYRSWFDEVTKREVEFDIIGLSYYPFWHGTLEELSFNLNDISKRYNKEVLVVETAYGFTLESQEGCINIFSQELADQGGYDPTPQGQSDFLVDLYNCLRSVENQKGLGFVYWEPAWIPVKNSTWATKAGRDYIKDTAKGGNSWANQSLFDYQGNALPALKAIKEVMINREAVK
ncbi:MAG TPA: glycosyl hydrolase 53 family protein [Candidatus Merdenecus merdavium]|nr:glycosyl hydrolase 53 family protein [Candidatus Merdenecus merdavium]